MGVEEWGSRYAANSFYPSGIVEARAVGTNHACECIEHGKVRCFQWRCFGNARMHCSCRCSVAWPLRQVLQALCARERCNIYSMNMTMVKTAMRQLALE